MKKKVSPVDLCKFLKIDNYLSNGNLGFFNFSDLIPFRVERLYYVNQLKKGDVRGNHAHLKLEQFIFLLNGAIKITIEDGLKSKDIYMEADNVGLYLPPMIWRSIIAENDMTSFVVLASLEYSENDYVRNYEDFMQNYARSN